MPTYPPKKKSPLFFYRPVPVTALVRGGVVAVVPLRRPVSITTDVGSGVTAFDNRYWWLFYLASAIAWRRFGHLTSVITSVLACAIWPFGFGDGPCGLASVIGFLHQLPPEFFCRGIFGRRIHQLRLTFGRFEWTWLSHLRFEE